jgi:hypothetical protein
VPEFPYPVSVTVDVGVADYFTKSFYAAYASADPFEAAQNAVVAISADVIRGWLGAQYGLAVRETEFKPDGVDHDAPGKISVTLTVTVKGDRKEFLTLAETTTSMTRAIVAAMRTAASEADDWIAARKREAGDVAARRAALPRDARSAFAPPPGREPRTG